MKRGSILFCSAYIYLAKPQFFAITPYLKEYRKIFLEVRDPVSQNYDTDFANQEEFLKYFDDLLQVKKFDFSRKGKIQSFRSYRKYKNEIADYFNKIKPLAVVSCSDMALSDRILSQLCKKKKVPFIIIQPAFIKNIYKQSDNAVIKSIRLLINKITGIPIYRKQQLFGNEAQWTHLFLWSKYFVENPKRKNMYFLGNPAFDYLFKTYSIKNKFNKRVLICTQDFENLVGERLFNNVIEIYMEAIRSRPNITFYIKFHPRENLERYKTTLNSGNYPNVNIKKEQNLYDLFKLCDAQISANSFTSLEAAAMGIPIIIVNPNNELKFYDHFKEEINPKVINPEEIGKVIDMVISKEYWTEFSAKREAFFKKLFIFIDGMSGKRVADKISEIINISKKY